MLKHDCFTHGIMFHHFHNEKHPISQGSISGEQFKNILDWTNDNFVLNNAQDYLDKFEAERLTPVDVCLTFDDALLSQAEVAGPILREENIQAFFFIYSSPYFGQPDSLEIYRYFRNTFFTSIDVFYESFFHKAQYLFPNKFTKAEKTFDANEYLHEYSFYSLNDRWFRYLRDLGLGTLDYKKVMDNLIAETNFDISVIAAKLWMSVSDIQDLSTQGHLVGLHSFSHPVMMHLLDRETQTIEYSRNLEHLRSLIGREVTCMSHPCGNYNLETLEILKTLGIKIGFRDNCSVKKPPSNLEIPRQDSSNLIAGTKT